MRDGRNIYKAQKLIKVKVKYDDRIREIEINGDFFLHPEESIADLERMLVGGETNKEKIRQKVKEFLSSGVEAFGFDAETMSEAIIGAIKVD